jgi:predicted DCC family thiol-disulfide oxidoreductase YuxK
MKPALIYDADCNFCRYWIARWQARTGDSVDYRSSSEAAQDFPNIPAENFGRAVQFVDKDGHLSSGAEAVFRCLSRAPGRRWLESLYQGVPGFAPVSEAVYRLIAAHRRTSAFVTRMCWGRHYEPPHFFLARWIFLRNLGIIFFVAFLSFYHQLDGLIGANGILPAFELNQVAADRLGAARYWQLPTLYWLHPTDGFLHALCLAGILASLLILAGVLTPLAIFVAWAAYLSLVNVARDFLGFQWDILLVETAFLAMFLAPFQLLPRLSREVRPVPFILVLHWWLLFRLMFASGFVKLDDPTWTRLEALNVHYETQPLSTVAGWYFHQMPGAFQKISVVIMFGIELGVPFLIFLPRRIRHAGAALMIAFQILISLTGNYTFFNWLTIALCLLIFDDQALRAALRRLRWTPTPPAAASQPLPRFKWALGGVPGAFILVLTLTAFSAQLTRGEHVPRTALNVWDKLNGFHLANTYGLFAHMTTSRPEIIVEGSADGREWKPYRFKWKPGDLDRPPGRVAPFQPRLDWQMWFAALGSPDTAPWFSYFMLRLLQGSPDVLALLEENPFPDAPPQFVRAGLYDYRFTTLPERRDTGNWWRREYLRPYFPPVDLPPRYSPIQ